LERLSLIAHRLGGAQTAHAELRYEGRGGMGGFIMHFLDWHSPASRRHALDEHLAREVMGLFWPTVLRRYRDWNQGPGSFGVMSWDLKQDLVRHLHHQRIAAVKATLIEGL
jgi:hypothetical protein